MCFMLRYDMCVKLKDASNESHLRVIGIRHDVFTIGGCKLEGVREFVGFVAAGNLL